MPDLDALADDLTVEIDSLAGAAPKRSEAQAGGEAKAGPEGPQPRPQQGLNRLVGSDSVIKAQGV